MTPVFRHACRLAMILLCCVVGTVVAAQERSPAQIEADKRFASAIRLVNAGDLGAAIAEFKRSQALAPGPDTEYNLGLLYAEVGRPAEASTMLEAALDHSSALSTEQTHHAADVLAVQQSVIGRVTLHVNVREGFVEIDNVEVAKLPLVEPLRVARGMHVIGVIAPGHAPARRELVVAGATEAELSIELTPIDGRLAHIELTSRLPEADVFVDDQRIGNTPLESSITVAPGSHELKLARLGYHDVTRTVKLTDGARASVDMTPELNGDALQLYGGQLRISSSEPLSTVTVDGTSYGVIAEPLTLPQGPHVVRVDRAGFEPRVRAVQVERLQLVQVAILLDPTPETRGRYIEHALRMRRLRSVGLALAVATLATGAVLVAVGQHALPPDREQRAVVELDWTPDGGGVCDPRTEITPSERGVCNRRLNEAYADVLHDERLRETGWILLGAGAAGALAAAVWWALSPGPHRYDRPPDLRRPELKLMPQLSYSQLGVSLQTHF